MSQKTKWIIEDFYFGNANTPSSERWRYSGTRYQVELWDAFKTESEALKWVGATEAALGNRGFEARIERDKRSLYHPWRTYIWFEPDDGVAMKWYLKSKSAAWL